MTSFSSSFCIMPIIVLSVYLAVELSKYLLCRPIDVCHVKCGQTSVYIGLHGRNWRRETDIIIIFYYYYF